MDQAWIDLKTSFLLRCCCRGNGLKTLLKINTLHTVGYLKDISPTSLKVQEAKTQLTALDSTLHRLGGNVAPMGRLTGYKLRSFDLIFIN